MVPTWKLTAVQVLALACLGIVIGQWLKRKIPLLDRLNIPAAIVGGMIYALAALILRDRYVNLDADATLRDLLMIAFMTTIGLSARWQLIREGGTQVIWMLGIASVGAVLQNVLGIGLAKAMWVDPRLGILAGSVALTGGPGTSIAWGGTFEKMGVQGATASAMASATFGIAVAGLIGGYIGGWLIRRYKLKPSVTSGAEAKAIPVSAEASLLLKTVLVIGVAMGIGSLISAGIERMGVILPGYIGAMIAGAVIRNLDDRFRFADVSQREVDAVGRIALYLFIAMAMLTLRLWELAHLAVPLLIILAAQVVLCWLMCITICYWSMGRDYEAAVMSAGFCGFMLGITANAVACMEELAEKFGPARRAFLVVPVVGAFLVDFTNSLIITAMANWLR
ncbi:MAG TPA: sodium/glutamate symporter [Bryobacteraceae bacterium]|nr:sodium/glutamate symporter [Bryobacteraceae bacterium]